MNYSLTKAGFPTRNRLYSDLAQKQQGGKKNLHYYNSVERITDVIWAMKLGSEAKQKQIQF